MRRYAKMQTIDWAECPGVEINPRIQSGAPVFKGTRIPVNVITNNVHQGGTREEIDEIIDNFPVTREQVQSVLDFVTRLRTVQSQP